MRDIRLLNGVWHAFKRRGRGCRGWRPSIMILLVVLRRMMLSKTATAKSHVEAILVLVSFGRVEIDLQAYACTHFGAAVSQNGDLNFSR